MISPTQVRLSGYGPRQMTLPLPRWEPAKLPSSLGQPLPQMPTGQQIKAAAAGFLVVPTLLAGLTSYVGFRLGSEDEGIPSVLGYVVGTLAGLAALSGLLMTIGIMKAELPEFLREAIPAPAPRPPITPAPAPKQTFEI